MTLTKLPGSKWWIETDDTSYEIIGTYNKTVITADIQAIRDTLALLPSASVAASDVSDVLALVAAKAAWNEARRARVTQLVNDMYMTYLGDPRQVEIAQLQSRLDALIALRERLV